MRLYEYIVILTNGGKESIVAESAHKANIYAESKYGYANICVAPQESLKKEVR